MKGDLEAYLAGLGRTISIFPHQPDEDLLQSLVIPQLRTCKDLELDFVSHDRPNENATERTTQWMLDAARRSIDRKRRFPLEASLMAPTKATPVFTPKVLKHN